MGFFSNLFSKPVVDVAQVVTDGLDKLFTSDDERLDKQAILERIKQQPNLMQMQINLAEAGHRSIFVAGWRPSIGWVCSISLALYYIPQFILADIMWVYFCLQSQQLQPYPLSANELLGLVFALLGLGAMRTYEKVTGKN